MDEQKIVAAVLTAARMLADGGEASATDAVSQLLDTLQALHSAEHLASKDEDAVTVHRNGSRPQG